MTGDVPIPEYRLFAGKFDMVDLFLPKMLKLSQPGRHTLLCHTELAFYEGTERSSEITTETSTVLTILPADQSAMGKVIDRLGTIATTEPGKNLEATQAMQQATESLREIEDVQVIPWLVKMFQMHNYYQKSGAIAMLSRFNSSVAFETLQAGLNVHESDLDDCTPPQEAAKAVQSLRISAIRALAGSPYSKALPLLKTKLHDPDDVVREALVYALGSYGPPEATKMLQEMAHDPNPKIRDHVNYYLKLRHSN
jgi:hypothetical protein